MIDLTDNLTAIDEARQRMSPDATEGQNEAAVAEIGRVLAEVAAPIGEFVRALDDGTGVSNSTGEFAEALVQAVGPDRLATMMFSIARTVTMQEAQMFAKMFDLFSRPIVDDDFGDAVDDTLDAAVDGARTRQGDS